MKTWVVPDALLIVVARTISGLSGYAVLAIAANKLNPSQFSELALFQTILFLIQIFFDTGLVHLANRETAGNPDWRRCSDHFQGIRNTVHLGLGLLVALLAVAGAIKSTDTLLPIACVLAILSNPFNSDWILFCRQERRIWASKVILIGMANVLTALVLLNLWSQPSAVLSVVALTNFLSGLYLYRRRFVSPPSLRWPTLAQVRTSAQLSLGGLLVHSGYNLPLIAVTSFIGGVTAGAFACLYRLFSASTMFVPTVVDFSVAREIAKLKGEEILPSRKVFIRLLLSGLALVSPIVFLPAEWLYYLFSLAVNLEKFEISSSSFTPLKIGLILYCLDFCTQRTAYIFDDRKLLIVSSFAALSMCLVSIFLIATGSARSSAEAWFYPVFAYQIVASLSIFIKLRRVAGRSGA